MRCNYRPNFACGRCAKYVNTTEVKGTADRLDLIIPAQSLCNCTTICICIAQDIPAEVTKDTPVFIIVGADEYPVINRCVNFVYGDQVKAGRMYCFKFGTDTLAFIYVGGWRLCPTKHAFTCIPLPAPPVKKTSKKAKPKASEVISNDNE